MLFERLYEDNVSGKISDERFSRMSRRYEDEQKELTEKIKQLRSEIEKQSSRTMTTDMFISLVRKYTRAKKLTPRMLNELVEKIEVFNAEKVNVYGSSGSAFTTTAWAPSRFQAHFLCRHPMCR